jgi:hypothetical protein
MVRKITNKMNFSNINDIIDLTLMDERRKYIAEKSGCSKTLVFYVQNELDLL